MIKKQIDEVNFRAISERIKKEFSNQPKVDYANGFITVDVQENSFNEKKIIDILSKINSKADTVITPPMEKIIEKKNKADAVIDTLASAFIPTIKLQIIDPMEKEIIGKIEELKIKAEMQNAKIVELENINESLKKAFK